jgi:hypothetical protein
MEDFITGDPNCPIESYQAMNLGVGITTHSGCTVPSNSNPCKQLITDISIVATYVITFKIKVEGGNEVDSSPITVTVTCPNTITITQPL